MPRKIKRRKRPDTCDRPIKRRKHKRGWRKAFTPKRKRILLEALRAGLTNRRAAYLAGISEVTFYDWMRRGKAGEPIYKKLYKKSKAIEAGLEKEALSIIRRSAMGGHEVNETKVVLSETKGRELTTTTKKMLPTWTAAAWILERKFPDHYGKENRDPLRDKSPDDVAAEVKTALDALMTSVPTGEDAELPEDMPT